MAGRRRGVGRQERPPRTWVVHLTVLASYALLSVALTAPLVLHFGSHVPGDGIDDPALTWNLWWVWDSLLNGRDLFHCDYMFHPIGINLAFYTLTVLNGALSGPLQSAIGLVTASNLVLLSSYVISGYGAFLLCVQLLSGRDRSARMAAAWFGGVVYAFAAPKLFYAALGQFNVASSQWAPFAALTLLAATRGRRSPAVLAGLFLALQAWAEMTYASFLVVFAVLIAVGRLAEAIVDRASWRSYLSSVAAPLAIAAAVFVALISPLLAAMIPDMLVEGDFSVVGGGFADVFSADLAGLFVPTILHPWLGEVVPRYTGILYFDKGQHLWFGFAVWVLAGTALVRARDRRVVFWAVTGLVFLSLSLGPVLQANGAQIRAPMPFQVFQELPFFKANRYPSRYGVMVALALGALGARGLAALMGRKKRAWLAGLFGAVFVLENLSAPLPLSDMTVPSVYRTLAADQSDTAVLELPLAWRNGFRVTGAHDVAIMFGQYYQTFHGKRLVGGNTSRNPEFKFQYFSEMPVLESIVALEAGRSLQPETEDRDRLLAPAVVATLGVSHVVIHSPPVSDGLLRYIEEVLPVRLIEESDGRRLYEVDHSQAGLDIPLSVALAEGWGRRESPAIAVRTTSRVVAPGGAPSRLTLALQALGGDGSLRVRVEGRYVGGCELQSAASECTVALPQTDEPVQVVELVTQQAYDPSALAIERYIGSTGIRSPVDIYVRSAGEEFGDLGRIYVAGVDVSPNGRGYNLVAINPDDGAILSALAFDTHSDPSACDALGAYVAALEPGTIVAGAVADEASLSLTPAAVDALRGLGAAGDLRGCFRCAHAFIGVAGAEAGGALEEWTDIGVAEALVGLGLTEPAAYFELLSVRVER